MQDLRLHIPEKHVRLYYNCDHRDVEVFHGDVTEAESSFHWRVYGKNLAFIAHVPGGWDADYALYVYSRRHGTNIVLDPGLPFGRYWKACANETGIALHRHQEQRGTDDPKPLRFTADYLSAL